MKPYVFARSLGEALLIPLFLLLLAAQPHAVEDGQENASSAWSEAKDAFDKFVREPSFLAAREFYASAFNSPGIDSDKTEILDYIFGHHLYDSVGRYTVIAIEMLNGNIYATRSAMRLLDYVDNAWRKPHELTAHVLRRVGESLGRLTRVNPALFLRACREEMGCPYFKANGWPVGFISEIMSTIKTRASYELEMRREALRSVENPELRLIRDGCVAAIDRLLENYVPGGPDIEEKKPGSFADPREKIKRVFSEINRRPSAENMKKVVALFWDVPRVNFYDVIRAMFPIPRQKERPFDLIFYEAECCNEYAIEAVFSVTGIVDDVDSMFNYNLISNLILMKPALFIETLDWFRRFLVTEASNIPPDRVIPLKYLRGFCAIFPVHDYPEDCESLILKRRIDALEALDMPEHKELINICISVIEKRLKMISSPNIRAH